jgi:hypothetical protein
LKINHGKSESNGYTALIFIRNDFRCKKSVTPAAAVAIAVAVAVAVAPNSNDSNGSRKNFSPRNHNQIIIALHLFRGLCEGSFLRRSGYNFAKRLSNRSEKAS